tara:strand:+ start:3888 stop:4865 length:978 start_codon:yes stop_codon:yes gene_type:complete
MPPKLVDLAKELADLKKKLANGGAAANAADPGTALVIVDTAKSTEDPAEEKSGILTAFVKGFEEVGAAFGPWARQTGTQIKAKIVKELTKEENGNSDTPTAAPKLEDNPLKEEVVQLQQQQATMMELMQQQATMMQAFMKQHQSMLQAPPAPPVQPRIVRFQEGQKVRCNWDKPGHQYDGDAYEGTVTAVYNDGTYDVQFDDDKTTRCSVPHNDIQSVSSGKRKAVRGVEVAKSLKCDPRPSDWKKQVTDDTLDPETTPLPSANDLRAAINQGVNVSSMILWNWMTSVGFRCGRFGQKDVKALLTLREAEPTRVKLKPGEQVVWP